MRPSSRAPFFSIALMSICCAVQAQDMQSKLDRYMQASVKVDHFMGSVLVAQNGKILFSRGYGMAHLKRGLPNTPQTEFRIGSVTKEFTAMAVLQLQARGKLRIRDPICKYVPQCPDDWRPITIYDLLTHTSGIPNFTSFANYLQLETETVTPAQLLADFKNKPLDFEPGAKFSYSNSGYEVLGYIIQRVSGDSYEDFLQKNIFGPLGMSHTGYDTSRHTNTEHAQGYAYSPDGYKPVRFVNMTVPYSAGALYSTVLDLYKWDRAVHHGKLIPQDLLNQMLSPQVAIGGPAKAHYGFGWMISTELGHKEISHTGGIEGFTALNSWFPDDDAYVIVLDNVSSPVLGAVGRALTAILFGRAYEIPKEHEAISLKPEALEKFVGQYRLMPNFILTVRRAGDQLITQATGQGPLPIYPESKHEFFAKLVDAQIAFVENAKGDVTGLVLHQNGRNVPAKRISATAPPLPKAISLPASVLAKYAGRYRLAPNFVLNVTRSGDHLSAQATGQQAAPIYPESRTRFFYKVVDAKIDFQLNSAGRVTGLVLHQGGRNIPAKKIE